MSYISHECNKKNCYYCNEIKRLEALNKAPCEPLKANRPKSIEYYNRIIQGLKTPQE